MSAQRRQDTAVELRFRRELYRAGVRYRVAYPVPGLPRRSIDVALPGRKVAIFIDGCYWHRCPRHHVPAKHNAAWWSQKLEANVRRDEETTRHLTDAGWHVVRFWEHDDVPFMVEHVQALVTSIDGVERD